MNILRVMCIQIFGGLLEIFALPIDNRWEHPCYKTSPKKAAPDFVPRVQYTLKDVLENLVRKSDAFIISSSTLRNKYKSKRRLTGMSLKMIKELPNADFRDIKSFNATEVFPKQYEQLIVLAAFYKDMLEAERKFDYDAFNKEMEKSENDLYGIMCGIYKYSRVANIRLPEVVSKGIIPKHWTQQDDSHDRFERGFRIAHNAMQFAKRLAEKYFQMFIRL